MKRHVTLTALLAALLLVFATPTTAHAAGNGGVVVMRVKSATEVTGSAVFETRLTGDRQVLRIVARFSDHKTNSVKLAKFRLCFSQSSDEAEVLTSRIKVFGKKVWSGMTKWDIASGSCTKWVAVNKTFSGKPGKEMFTVNTDLGWTGASTTHAFLR